MKLRLHRHGRKKKGDARAVAAQLAPPEEQAGAMKPAENNGNGSIVIDTGKLAIPQGLEGSDGPNSRIYDFDPAVIIIFFLSLAFIIFIAVLISRMPPPAG